MKIFEEMEKRDHEELIFNYFKDVDLKMIISLHNTTLGKTIGGLQMNEYDSELNAIVDSLRLSQIMTYQGATAETDSGGASAILLGNPKTDKTEAYLRAVGRFVESLKGQLILSPDLGTETQDFRHIRRETEYTIFPGEEIGETKPTAQVTACGVYWGIKACAKHRFGASELDGRSFAIQGVGEVGKCLVEYLKKEKTKIYISDLVYDNIKEVEDKHPEVEVLKPSAILLMDTDFLVPCAVGSIIHHDNVDLLRCKVIAGAALNIFTHEELIDRVYERGILYAPSFLIAAGDLLLLDKNLKLGSVKENLYKTQIIYNRLIDILQRAADQGISPYHLAKQDALERGRKIDCIKNILC